MKILLVENDKSLVKVVTSALTQQNYVVDVATDGQSGWEFVEVSDYNLILLDVTLPKLDGISFCRQLRQAGYRMPVLLLAIQSTSRDRIIGLDAGADDYAVKPFDLEELMARIRALLRRGSHSLPPTLEWGSLCLNPNTCEVTYEGDPLRLTPKEYSLLKLFLQNSHRVFSPSDILDHLWTFEDPPEEETIKSHIKGLRKKLKAVGATNPIETVYGLGYRLSPFHQEKSQLPPSTQPENWTQRQTIMAMNQAWDRYKVGIHDHVLVLEQTIAALRRGVNHQLRQQAEQEAHKLVCSLGAFGFTQSAQLSQEIKQLLQAKAPLDSTQAQQLSKLVIALHRQLEETLDKQISELIPNSIDLATKPVNQFEMVQALDQLLCLAKRYSQPLYLAILELDNFKQVRQQHDDVARDIVLQQLWQFLRQMFRSTDVVVYQGDGANLIGLYGMTKESGMKRLTEILEVLHQQEFTGPNDIRFRATFRASAAEYPKDGTDLQTLYQVADTALSQKQA